MWDRTAIPVPRVEMPAPPTQDSDVPSGSWFWKAFTLVTFDWGFIIKKLAPGIVGAVLFGVNLPFVYLLFWVLDSGRLVTGQYQRRRAAE